MDQQSTPRTDQDRRIMMNAEAEVEQVMMDFAKCIRSGNLDEIMSFYSDDVVAFDMLPPLRVIGKENYRKSWEQYTSSAQFPFGHEFKEMNVVASGDVAYCYCLVHMNGRMKDGTKMETWVRETAGFRKMNGKWLIEHEQQSAPVDMNTGKAMFDLQPENEAIH